MHCVDLGESFPTHSYLQNFVSIQPRTSLLQSEQCDFDLRCVPNSSKTAAASRDLPALVLTRFSCWGRMLGTCVLFSDLCTDLTYSCVRKNMKNLLSRAPLQWNIYDERRKNCFNPSSATSICESFRTPVATQRGLERCAQL